ncbi:MAG: trypsin-like serine protease [Myxococcota bacterium]
MVACAAEDPAAEQSTHDIVGGSETEHYPAVVLLEGDSWCTGTVVAPRTVLTAAHCENARDHILIGHDVEDRDAMIEIDIDRFVPHPDYESDWRPHDIAYVILAEEAPVKPALVSVGIDTWLEGHALTFVGFGRDHVDGGSGRKRKARIEVTSVKDDFVMTGNTLRTWLFSGPQFCDGDSGGPGLFEWEGTDIVVSVNSGSNCRSYGRSVRVDVHEEFVAEGLRQGA